MPRLQIVGDTTTGRSPIPTVLLAWLLRSKVNGVANHFRSWELAGVGKAAYTFVRIDGPREGVNWDFFKF